MEAIKRRVKRRGKSITVSLPETFTSKEFDLIISPVEESNDSKAQMMSQKEFKDFLLSAPVMSDKEYQLIKEKQKHFNAWK